MTHLEMQAWRAFWAGGAFWGGSPVFPHGPWARGQLGSSLLVAYSNLFRPRSWAGWVGPLGGWARPFVNG